MSRLAVVACWLAVAVRVVLVLGLIAISIAFATHPAGTWNWRTWDWMYDIVLGVFILPMLVYIALAFTLRCPSCRRCFLVERGKKHPASRKMDIWVTGAPLCAAFSASANSRWRKVAPSSRIRRSPSASAAELEAQQARQELAHFSRVSTIGELAASLAHELNQPLTGALANARAALRLLEATGGGHGPSDLEVHHRAPRWTDLGHGQRDRRRDLPLLASPRRQEVEVIHDGVTSRCVPAYLAEADTRRRTAGRS